MHMHKGEWLSWLSILWLPWYLQANSGILPSKHFIQILFQSWFITILQFKVSNLTSKWQQTTSLKNNHEHSIRRGQIVPTALRLVVKWITVHIWTEEKETLNKTINICKWIHYWTVYTSIDNISKYMICTKFQCFLVYLMKLSQLHRLWP